MPLEQSRQDGTATIELALVFSLLFAMLWAIISYALPLILMQAMHKAAAESIRVAAQVPVSASDYQTQVRTLVIVELQNQLNWLPSGWLTPLDLSSTQNVTFTSVAGCPAERPSCLVTVELRYPDYEQQPIVPGLLLPGVGQVPQLPTDLVASARTML